MCLPAATCSFIWVRGKAALFGALPGSALCAMSSWSPHPPGRTASSFPLFGGPYQNSWTLARHESVTKSCPCRAVLCRAAPARRIVLSHRLWDPALLLSGDGVLDLPALTFFLSQRAKHGTAMATSAVVTFSRATQLAELYDRCVRWGLGVGVGAVGAGDWRRAGAQGRARGGGCRTLGCAGAGGGGICTRCATVCKYLTCCVRCPLERVSESRRLSGDAEASRVQSTWSVWGGRPTSQHFDPFNL